MRVYNDQAHTVWQSVPFEVTHGSGWMDPNNAKDYQNNAPGGTVTYDDALGRIIAVQDPNIGQGGDGIACSATLSGNYTACNNYSIGQVGDDTNYYVSVSAVDPNKHVTANYADALDKPTSVVVTDLVTQSGQTITSATTTTGYDDLGRQITLSDPDRGSHTYSYDADGQLITDVSSTRTLGYVYDLLGRLGCVQNVTPTESASGTCTPSATKKYIQNTYDTTNLGAQGTTDFPVGQLSKSVAITYYPDLSSPQVTELYQHDQRGRLITEQMQFGLPSGWNVTTALPTYQIAQSYNDADQSTTTTTSTNPSGLGYTTTQVYDSTTGVQTGLSNNSTATANLATLSFNARAQLDTISFQTTSGTALASEQFSYDANLRTTSSNGIWLSGSGTSGTVFNQSDTYDPASNITSLTTTQATISGFSSSGGTETQNFCYDEQNRLVWAGNSGTQPAAGNGTCGSGTLSSGLSGATYSNSYIYTHLGQLWQGPLNGSSTQEQYLYCGSTPHQLTGLYPTTSGATCSNYTGKTADYSSGYDAWGNVTSRTFSNTTSMLSFDDLDTMTEWNAGSANLEQYVYDPGGERVLRRSTNGSGTTMTVYAFRLEDHLYSGSGTLQGTNNYYYTLAGQLIGKSDGTNTTFYLTDSLGSVQVSFSNTANSAAVKGNQVYGPYGKQRYHQGTIGTAKGFTGQYNDSLTGLDYYGARYSDPVAAVFLSADTVQGNGSGDNPYAYVSGNPETLSDPTGHCTNLLECVTDPVIQAIEQNTEPIQAIGQAAENGGGDFFGPLGILAGLIVGGIYAAAHPTQLASGDLTTPGTIFTPTNTLYFNNFNSSVSFTPHTAPPPTATGGNGNGSKPPITIAAPAPCSFTFDTRVSTNHGEKAIGTLRVGDKVLAYNPETHKIELESVLHVWTHTDSDLVDIAISYSAPAQHSKGTTQKSEVLHTTSEHPFMTTEHGFVPAGNLKTGMHVLGADGSIGVITGWRVVSGTQLMYNLEVAQDHTFTVGDGQWVVHNECDSGPLRSAMQANNAQFQTGQEAHHVIPCSVYNRGHGLLTQAGNLFDPNAAYNGRALYNSQYSIDAMNEAQPYHTNAPEYAVRVRSMMDAELQRLQSNGLTTPQNAFDSLMGITDQLNQWMNQLGTLSFLFQTPCPIF